MNADLTGGPELAPKADFASSGDHGPSSWRNVDISHRHVERTRTEREFRPRLNQLQADVSEGDGWCNSGPFLAASCQRIVIYGIPPTRFEIKPPLNAEPLFHIACWLANLPPVQTTAHAYLSFLSFSVLSE